MTVAPAAITDDVDERGTPEQRKRARHSAASALIGGALEYYDFYCYSLAAAIVFPSIMFPDQEDPVTGVLLSLATLGVGYVARPLGAIVFGHFGDKFGRKNVLMVTIVLMGVVTFVVGILPTYDQVGIIAPIILVVMRLAQGFSAGAETTGASTITIESAPNRRRAFYTSFTQAGNWTGFVLANLVFLPIAALPTDILFSWGWRIPFLLSVIVVLIAIFIRRRLQEPEIFVEEVDEADEAATVPLVTTLRHYPVGVLKVLLLTTSACIGTIMFTFGLAFATRPEFGIELPYTTMIWAAILGNALGVLLHPLFGLLADKHGRRPLMIVGVLGAGALSYLYFWAIITENVPLVFIGAMGAHAVCYAAFNATFQTFAGEQFNVKVRFTATSVGFQAGVIVVGFTPLIATSIVTLDNWYAAPTIILATGVAAALTALFSRETNRIPLEELGKRHPRR